MSRIPYETGGFAFADEDMSEKAVKEEEGIRYIKNSADMKDPRVVFQIYSQMIEQRLFQTPVGYVYLKDLQEYLMAQPEISNQDILPIPVAAYREKQAEKTKTHPKGSAERRETKQKPAKTKTKVIHKTIEKNVDYKPWFRLSLSVSVILLFIVIGMFAVTATSGNINIVNYENALIEKYEHWETQLKEKEESLKEKEKAMLESRE